MSPEPAVHARRRTARCFSAGVLCANSVPHLVCAAAGRRMLTPLAGPQSPPSANALWGAANLTAGLALLGSTGHGGAPGRPQLTAFATGASLFALWAVMAEKVLHVNG